MTKHFSFSTICLTLLAVFILQLAIIAVPTSVFAEDDPGGGDNKTGGDNTAGGDVNGKISIDDPLGIAGQGKIDDPAIFSAWLGGIVKRVIAPIGAIAFLMFVAGGFYWIFSAGNEERVKRGRDIMIWTAIGLIVIFAAYAILTFVIGAIGINTDTTATR